MALLKEDGSLDIERINQLPIEEYMEEVGNFTNEQRKEYYSKSALFPAFSINFYLVLHTVVIQLFRLRKVVKWVSHAVCQ